MQGREKEREGDNNRNRIFFLKVKHGMEILYGV